MLIYLALFFITCVIMTNILPDSLLAETRRKLADSILPHGENDGPVQSVFGDDPYSPTLVDLIVVRAMLTKGKKLPNDLVDIIYDHAEYWGHSTNEINFLEEHQSPLRVEGTSENENKFLLRAFPVGLTGIKHRKDLAEELAWDTNEAKPQPLDKEHDPEYFHRLVGYPTPKLALPVRKIVFSIRSKDQGWGGERDNRGTFNGSWTWFEAGLERFDANQTCDAQCTYDVRFKSVSSTASPLPVCGLRPLYPEIKLNSEDEDKLQYHHPLLPNVRHQIQRNRAAHREWQDHEVTWSYLDDVNPNTDEAKRMDVQLGRGRESLDGSFVRDLKLGDVVTIWAKARFPGWANHIEKVKIDIYWAI